MKLGSRYGEKRRGTGITRIPAGHVREAANQSHRIGTPLFRRNLLLNINHFTMRNMPSPLGNDKRHRLVMMEEGIDFQLHAM